ncbi:MAG: hypothetical protein R3C56_02855 [Pirellulaceae bacterium]
MAQCPGNRRDGLPSARADGLGEYWQLHQGLSDRADVRIKARSRRYFHPEKDGRCKDLRRHRWFCSPSRELDWSLLNLSPEEAHLWDECHLNFVKWRARALPACGLRPAQFALSPSGSFRRQVWRFHFGWRLAYRTLVEDYLKMLDELPEFFRRRSVGMH